MDSNIWLSSRAMKKTMLGSHCGFLIFFFIEVEKIIHPTVSSYHSWNLYPQKQEWLKCLGIFGYRIIRKMGYQKHKKLLILPCDSATNNPTENRICSCTVYNIYWKTGEDFQYLFIKSRLLPFSVATEYFFLLFIKPKVMAKILPCFFSKHWQKEETLSLACYITWFKLPRSCHFPRTALNLSSSSLPKHYWAAPEYGWIRGLQCNALLLLRTDSCVVLSLMWWKKHNLFICAMRDNFYFMYHPI